MAVKKREEPISDLPKIGTPATAALHTIGVATLEQLTRYTEKEVLALHGMGPKAIRLLKAAMEEKGIAFKEA